MNKPASSLRMVVAAKAEELTYGSGEMLDDHVAIAETAVDWSVARLVAWVREQADEKDYGTGCVWRNVADAIEQEAISDSWRCECGDLNRDHEAFCYRCGAGQPEAT